MGAALAMPVIAVARPAARRWLGVSDSLNAAVAGALLLYEALARDGQLGER